MSNGRLELLGQVEALGVHHVTRLVRVVGDEPVQAAVDRRRHVGRGVDGPRDDRQAVLVRGLDERVGDVGVVDRQDLGVELVGHHAGEVAVEGMRLDVDAAGPGRPGEDGRGLGQRRATQARLDLAGGLQRAPVEGLKDRALGHVVARDDRDDLLGERRRAHGLLGERRVALGLDVELDLVGAVAVDELEDLGQARHVGAGDGLLRADERVGRGVGGVARAAVELLDLRVGQLVDELADIRALALERRDAPLMGDDHHSVLGHAGVELERRDAHLERLAERGERVLGTQPAGAAMAFEIEGARRRRLRARAEHDERREGGGDTPGA